MFKLFVIMMAVTAAYGMDCTLGTSDSVSDKFFKSCPRLLIDSADEKYCCPDKCCDFFEFVKEWSFTIVPIIILVLVLSFVISCICCFCCPFCFVYKRRH